VSLPKSLTQPLRQNLLFVGSGWRGYFAPFNTALAVTQNNTSIGPTIYDLQTLGQFLDNPAPTGWTDLGFIDKLKFTPGSKIGSVKTGYRMATRARYRGEVDEKCTFTFRESTHIAMKIATGTQVFNLLKSTASASTLGPLSSSGTTAVAVGASGYIASSAIAGASLGKPVLFVPAGSGALYPAGTYIVCDRDMTGGEMTAGGYIGDSGAYVFPGAVSDADYVRKTSDYVACVAQVIPTIVSGQDGLVLTAPFFGGGSNPALGGTVYNVPELNPASRGAKIQAISGYTSREGGSYLKEWSAVFVKSTIDGSQMLLYYPRLSPESAPGVEETAIDGITSEQTQGWMASMDALAFDDPLDGETVVRYAAYFPAPGGFLTIQA
jgi:hypothetical protein